MKESSGVDVSSVSRSLSSPCEEHQKVGPFQSVSIKFCAISSIDNVNYFYKTFIRSQTRSRTYPLSSSACKGKKPELVPLTSSIMFFPDFLSWIASTVQISRPLNILEAASIHVRNSSVTGRSDTSDVPVFVFQFPLTLTRLKARICFPIFWTRMSYSPSKKCSAVVYLCLRRVSICARTHECYE